MQLSIFTSSCKKTEVKDEEQSATETTIPNEIEDIIVWKLENALNFAPRKVDKYIFVNEEEHGMDGLFVKYEMVDYNDSTGKYPLRGLRLYEKNGDEYDKISFDNPYAWMCEGCNNSRNSWLIMKKDTLKLIASWGPRQEMSSNYYFQYKKLTKKWTLMECNYTPIKQEVDIILDNYNGETTEYQREIYANRYNDLHHFHDVIQRWNDGEDVGLRYITSWVDHQLAISEKDVDELIEEMSEDDYTIILECAPILQNHRNYIGKYILKKVMEKYPNHDLNILADEMLKQYELEDENEKEDAENEY